MRFVVVAAVIACASTSWAQAPNRPPHIEVAKRINVGVGTELDFSSFEAFDPEGDVLTYGAEGLPAGARFETRTGDLLWTPTAADVGTFVVTFSVSDGTATVYALTRITVAAPPPLNFNVPSSFTLQVEDAFDVIVGVDPESTETSVTATGLPPGASFERRSLTWVPGSADIGDHVVTFEAHNRAEHATAVVVLHVRPKTEEWMSYALPGLGYSVYVPVGSPDVGIAQGPSFELVVAQWVHRNDNVGPSHGRVSLRADLLFPVSAPQDPGILYAASLALSLERNPERSFLVPIFAVDVGGLYQRQLGNALQVTPSIGVHLYQNRNIFVTAEVGYLLALPNLEQLHGPRATLSGNFTLW